MGGSSFPSNNLTPKSIKFLCSYGGRIIPRVTDGKLRYHGGDTRVLSVDNSISFSDVIWEGAGAGAGLVATVGCIPIFFSTAAEGLGLGIEVGRRRRMIYITSSRYFFQKHNFFFFLSETSMALRSKLRSLTLRRFSTSILSPDSKTPLTSKEKSRAALSLLRFEDNPERILDICRVAALTPDSHLDRISYSAAINKLKKSSYYEGIRAFINDSLLRPDLKSERVISHFIALYGQAGLLKDAVNLFDKILLF